MKKKPLIVLTVIILLAIISYFYFSFKKVVLTPVTTANVPGLPPDPGEAGKLILGGIDSDKDGVRDDVERMIMLKYPKSGRTREAMKDVAKSLQAAILASQRPDNGGQSFQISSLERKATQCLLYVQPEDTGIITDLEATIINTYPRFVANNLFEKQGAGQWDTSPAPLPANRKFSCSFNVDALPN